MVTARAIIEGYNKRWVWLRVPSIWEWKILTMPRETLIHGLASSTEVKVSVSPASLRHDGHGFVADLEIVGKIDEGDIVDAG